MDVKNDQDLMTLFDRLTHGGMKDSIQAEVLRLMEDVTRLDDRVRKLQTHFDQATKDIRDIRISADKITKRGDKIEDLQLSDDSPAEDLAPAQAPAQPTLRVLGSEDQ